MSFYAFRKPMANDVYINHYRTIRIWFSFSILWSCVIFSNAFQKPWKEGNMQKILLIVLISILTNSFHYQKQCRWGKREYFINTIHYHNFKHTRECLKTTSYEMDLSHDFFLRGLRAQVQNDVWGHLHRCTILLCVCMIDKTRLYQNQDIHDVGK